MVTRRIEELQAAFVAGLQLGDKTPRGRGSNLAADLRADFPTLRVRTIFDVGANVGQTASMFSEQFPAASIYSFEPGAAAFEELKLNIVREAMANVTAMRLALGASTGHAVLHVGAATALASISMATSDCVDEQVPMITIDGFCAESGVDLIDVLKIDVEGYELEVIAGARRMIDEGRVRVMQVETTLTSADSRFVPLDMVAAALPRYELYAVYNQRTQLSGRPTLGYFDAVFVHQSLIKE